MRTEAINKWFTNLKEIYGENPIIAKSISVNNTIHFSKLTIKDYQDFLKALNIQFYAYFLTYPNEVIDNITCNTKLFKFSDDEEFENLLKGKKVALFSIQKISLVNNDEIKFLDITSTENKIIKKVVEEKTYETYVLNLPENSTFEAAGRELTKMFYNKAFFEYNYAFILRFSIIE